MRIIEGLKCFNITPFLLTAALFAVTGIMLEALPESVFFAAVLFSLCLAGILLMNLRIKAKKLK